MPRKKKKQTLIGDSYMADPKDLKKLRRIAKREGVSKAALIRLGTKLVIYSYENKK